MLVEHLIEDEGQDVLRVDTRRRPRRHAGGFDLLAEGDVLLPGGGNAPALLLEERLVVPQALDRQRPVEIELLAVEDSGRL